MVLVSILTATFVGGFDSSSMLLAAPALRSALGASFAQTQLVVAGYTMSYAVALMTGGRLGDAFGRRRVFLCGAAGFTLTSAICALAGSPAVLIVARVVQGLTAALMLPQVLAIIHASLPAPVRRRAVGLYGVTIGLAWVAGPVCGGILMAWNPFDLGWRALFLVNVPIGALVVAGAWRAVPESHGPRTRLDVTGAALLGAALFLLLSVLGRSLDSHPRTSWRRWAPSGSCWRCSGPASAASKRGPCHPSSRPASSARAASPGAGRAAPPDELDGQWVGPGAELAELDTGLSQGRHRPGHDGHPDLGRDQSDDGLHVTRFLRHLDLESGGPGQAGDPVVQGRAHVAGEHDERLPGELGRGQRGDRRQRMPAGQRRDQDVTDDLLAGQALRDLVVAQGVQDAHVDPPGEQFLDLARAGQLPHLELHAGVDPSETAQQPGDQLGHGRSDEAEDELAHVAASGLPGGQLGPLHVVQGPAGLGDEALARRGDAHLPGGPVEQGDA
ncbi:Putative multidrug resistance protein MdtD [Streptomyces glaucescens]